MFAFQVCSCVRVAVGSRIECRIVFADQEYNSLVGYDEKKIRPVVEEGRISVLKCLGKV